MADGEAGRPGGAAPGESVFSAEMAEMVIGRVAAGCSLRSIAAEPGMPHRTTIRNWAISRPAFAEALDEAMRKVRIARRLADRGEAAARAARPKPARGGRPSTYSRAVGEAICTRLAQGETLIGIGRDPNMPAFGTILGWVKRHREFEDMYVVARQMQADYLFDEAREVGLAATPKTVWADRLRFDVIRWQTARMAPKKYCERLVIAQAEREPPRKVIMEVVNFSLAPNGKVVVSPPRNEAEAIAYEQNMGKPYDGPGFSDDRAQRRWDGGAVSAPSLCPKAEESQR